MHRAMSPISMHPCCENSPHSINRRDQTWKAGRTEGPCKVVVAPWVIYGLLPFLPFTLLFFVPHPSSGRRTSGHILLKETDKSICSFHWLTSRNTRGKETQIRRKRVTTKPSLSVGRYSCKSRSAAITRFYPSPFSQIMKTYNHSNTLSASQ